MNSFGSNNSSNVISLESSDVYSNSNSYYLAGIVFMVAVIILLLYVNLYYDNCLTNTCEDISKLPMCSCVKIFLVYENNVDQNQSTHQVKKLTVETPLQMSCIPQAV